IGRRFLWSELVGQLAGDDFPERDIGKGGAGSGFDQWTVAQAELTHAAGNDVDQQLLIWDHLSCFLQELGGHMAQGTGRAGGLGGKLKDGRRLAGNVRWNEV